VRALEPLEGVEIMRSLRPTSRAAKDLCSGPGRLARALDIDRSLDGIPLDGSSGLHVERVIRPESIRTRILSTPRIGVAYAEEWAGRRLRYCIRGNACVSGPSSLRAPALATLTGRTTARRG
jgi:DNA-3-methyladenine glycosylase